MLHRTAAMKNFRILHIDDDSLMRKLVTSTLSREPSFFIESCSGGEEGIAISKRWSPDLILCDVVMPSMDGRAVLTQVRQISSSADIPFLFTTARTNASQVSELMALGASAVIAKPFHLKALLDTVRDYLRINDEIIDDGDDHRTPGFFDFAERLRDDSRALQHLRRRIALECPSKSLLNELLSRVHKLAGVAGVYEFPSLSAAAAAVEEAVVGPGTNDSTPTNDPTFKCVLSVLDSLLVRIEQDLKYAANYPGTANPPP